MSCLTPQQITDINAEIAQLLEVGNSQLNELIEERNELSLALERHMINNQEDY